MMVALMTRRADLLARLQPPVWRRAKHAAKEFNRSPEGGKFDAN